MTRVRKLMTGAGLALAAAGCGHAAARTPVQHTTMVYPPGWVASPQGGPGQGATVCISSVCYRVDGNGDPYGQPVSYQQVR